jgi:hypothetical protein
MSNNFLEQLTAEWYEYRGYFVRRNVPVGKHSRGYECELDIIAYNPLTQRLAHLEPSMDAESWETRERRFRKKFEAGRKYIPGLFPGIALPSEIEQIAILMSASKTNHPRLGGGKVLLAADLVRDIIEDLSDMKVASGAVPEHHSILRALQFVVEFRGKVFNTLT